MNIEKHANSIAKTTSDMEDIIDWSKALNPEVEENMEEYTKAAECIVEPQGVDDDYYEFSENDPENWASFVRENSNEMYQDKWYALAQKVNEFGY